MRHVLLDLNGTLIFRSKDGKRFIRPRAAECLRRLHQYYNVGIVTSMNENNTLSALDAIDRHWRRYVVNVFSRDYTLPAPPELGLPPYAAIRDVSKITVELGVDVSELIFVDNDTYKYPKDCCVIRVSNYTGSDDDTDLDTVLRELGA
jgi:hypothetical protein